MHDQSDAALAVALSDAGWRAVGEASGFRRRGSRAGSSPRAAPPSNAFRLANTPAIPTPSVMKVSRDSVSAFA